MASTHQFARIAAFPCGDGKLQQVNVQDTHIIWMSQHASIRVQHLTVVYDTILLNQQILDSLNIKNAQMKTTACFWTETKHKIFLPFRIVF